jgi:hypothetical protein
MCRARALLHPDCFASGGKAGCTWRAAIVQLWRDQRIEGMGGTTMSIGEFLNNPAEFLSPQKRAVRKRREELIAAAPGLFSDFIYEDAPAIPFAEAFRSATAGAGLTERDTHELARQSCLAALRKALEDDYLDHQEERNLAALLEAFDMMERQASETSFRETMVKSAILREVGETGVSSRVVPEEGVDFPLSDGESLLWTESHAVLFQPTHEDAPRRLKKRAVAHLQRGDYLRYDGQRGQRLPYKHIKEVDEGWLAITNHGMHFAGLAKDLQFPRNTIMSIHLYEDGLVLLDGPGEPRLAFSVDDPWFVSNLINKV